MKRLAIIMLLTLISCSQGKTILPWEGYHHVFDRNGETSEAIDHSKHHYYLFTTEANFRSTLSHTPDGKIDKIIQENPSWQFIFYINADPADSASIMNMLKRYDCRFPVILDPEGDFLKVNSLENYTQIGFICNKEGKVLGVSTIGTTQSFFDQEFRYAKHEAGQ